MFFFTKYESFVVAYLPSRHFELEALIACMQSVMLTISSQFFNSKFTVLMLKVLVGLVCW